jgi:hypothetical protein
MSLIECYLNNSRKHIVICVKLSFFECSQLQKFDKYQHNFAALNYGKFCFHISNS